MLLNTLTYGTARVSRSWVYVLIALWYGISSDTDSFFLSYAIVTFLVLAISSTLGTVLVPRIKGVSFKDLVILGIFAWLIPFSSAYLLSSTLLLRLSPYCAFGVCSGLLQGLLIKEGRLTYVPVVTLISSGITLGVAFLLKGEGLLGLATALSVGEGIRLGLLVLVSPLSKKSLSFLSLLPYLVVFGLFSLPPIVVRVLAAYTDEGFITIISYAAGATNILITYATTGLLVRNSYLWGKLEEKELLEAWRTSLFPRLKVSVSVMVFSLFGGLAAYKIQDLWSPIFAESIHWDSVFGVFFILALTIPFYTLVFNSLTPLIVFRKLYLLTVTSLGSLFVAIFVANTLRTLLGLYAFPVALLLSEMLVAAMFVVTVWREGRKLRLEVV